MTLGWAFGRKHRIVVDVTYADPQSEKDVVDNFQSFLSKLTIGCVVNRVKVTTYKSAFAADVQRMLNAIVTDKPKATPQQAAARRLYK